MMLSPPVALSALVCNMRNEVFRVDPDLEEAITSLRDAIRICTCPTRLHLDIDAAGGGVLRWDLGHDDELFSDVERLMRETPGG